MSVRAGWGVERMMASDGVGSGGGSGVGGRPGGLLLAMMAKGGVYVLLSLLMWPVLGWVVTGAVPFGARAEPVAGVFAITAASFAAAACLAFAVSRVRVRDEKLKRLMGVGIVVAGVLLVMDVVVGVDVVRRNLPAQQGGGGGVVAPASEDAGGVSARDPVEAE